MEGGRKEEDGGREEDGRVEEKRPMYGRNDKDKESGKDKDKDKGIGEKGSLDERSIAQMAVPVSATDRREEW